jgi:hypothetical protein
MGIMGQALEDIKVLKGWRSMDLIPQIVEKEEDVWLIITYTDHGDDFALIGTKDGKYYEYGYFMNRRYFDPKRADWIRKPMSYKKEDVHAIAANEIYFRFERDLKRDHMSFGYDKIYGSQESAQRVFDGLLKFMNDMVNGEFFIEKWDYKEKLERWLILNGINTDENLEKLKKAKFDTKVDGFDGIAGKREIDKSYILYADRFNKIYANGKKYDRRKVSRGRFTDEWGITTYEMLLSRF